MATVRVRQYQDYEVDESLLPSEYQQEVAARNSFNHLHSGIPLANIVTEDDLVSATNPVFGAHVHNASGNFCEGCALMAQDGLS
jgi:hypothetical protein